MNILNMIINGLMAFGTLLAVIVALFQERIKLLPFIGPNLRIELVEIPDRIQSSFPSGNLFCRDLYYLKVINKGFSTAKNTKCEIARVSSRESESVLLREYYAPQFLPWHIKSKEDIFKLDLTPGEEKMVSFVFRDESDSKGIYLAGDTYNETDIRPINTIGFKEKAYKDDIELEIALYCENSKKKSYLCKVAIATDTFGNNGFQMVVSEINCM